MSLKNKEKKGRMLDINGVIRIRSDINLEERKMKR